ncbi:MAG TPA: hypothetical protein VI911_09105 [Patescibacteria group bacterium]|nr:MAG: hypothetical protein UR43_C0005G0011 [candidate division TM6 bacterium GW2011_GWF2_33_332]HLD91156.1 hypothetical protein [Patescibacteria group bacterium]
MKFYAIKDIGDNFLAKEYCEGCKYSTMTQEGACLYETSHQLHTILNNENMMLLIFESKEKADKYIKDTGYICYHSICLDDI